jgi:uncharacterized repeat protein (TIGR03803 family)
MGFTTLHHFAGAANNGRVPYGLLIPHEGLFYGTTTYGGPPYDKPPGNPANKGNLFKLNPDGTGFTVLHEFTGGPADGWKPWSGLALSGQEIFGSTVYGGPHGEKGGTLYTLHTDGSGFRLLHTFGDPNDGYGASTSPTRLGEALFGLTRWGGNGSGTIYAYDLAQASYRLLYRFAADGRDGRHPLGTLTPASDGFLYGLTWYGGRNDMGTLFRLKPDGSAFETLHHFAGGKLGKCPYDSPVFDGKHTLYGTTLGDYGNVPTDLGTLFKFDLSTRTHTVLHKFAGGPVDSGKPNGAVVLSPDGLLLYGTTHGDKVWGGNEFGILYQVNLDGSGFKILYEFNGKLAGDTPMRTPILLDGHLYGMTAFGGNYNYGVIWKYRVG